MLHFCVLFVVHCPFSAGPGVFQSPLCTLSKRKCRESILEGTTVDLKSEDRRSWHSVKDNEFAGSNTMTQYRSCPFIIRGWRWDLKRVKNRKVRKKKGMKERLKTTGTFEYILGEEARPKITNQLLHQGHKWLYSVWDSLKVSSSFGQPS